MSRAHAKLSCSGASRWMACTPSAMLEEEFMQGKVDKGSDASREGTIAHMLGEFLIKKELGILTVFDKAVYRNDVLTSQYYNEDMQQHCENYRDFVLGHYQDAQNITKDAVIFLEEKLDLTEYIPEGFGTSDNSIISDDLLHVIDLKYGKGIMVDAFENKQLMLYGLGAYLAYSMAYDIKRVRMSIFQPRKDNYSSYEISVEALLHWANTELKDKAQSAFDGKGVQVAGKHCGWCKVSGQCKANAEYNTSMIAKDFPQPFLLSDSEIVEVLEKLDTFAGWVKAVKDHAFSEAMGGKKWQGWKLVEGRSNRKYEDETAISSVLIKEGFAKDSIFNMKLKGLGDMEKLLGKGKFTELIGEYIVKPPGAPALVPESDKRQEYSQIGNYFAGELLTDFEDE